MRRKSASATARSVPSFGMPLRAALSLTPVGTACRTRLSSSRCSWVCATRTPPGRSMSAPQPSSKCNQRSARSSSGSSFVSCSTKIATSARSGTSNAGIAPPIKSSDARSNHSRQSARTRLTPGSASREVSIISSASDSFSKQAKKLNEPAGSGTSSTSTSTTTPSVPSEPMKRSIRSTSSPPE